MYATGLETEDKTLLGTNQRCAVGLLQPNYLSEKGATGIGKTGLSKVGGAGLDGSPIRSGGMWTELCPNLQEYEVMLL